MPRMLYVQFKYEYGSVSKQLLAPYDLAMTNHTRTLASNETSQYFVDGCKHTF